MYELLEQVSQSVLGRRRLPEATYRLQFHKDFTFCDAIALVPYLARLGISHIYASPLTQARPKGDKSSLEVVAPARAERR